MHKSSGELRTKNAHDVPAYGIAEAARYLKLAPATLRSWTLGRPYPRTTDRGFFDPLIMLADRDGKYLSFANLVEAHVLRALRTEHGVHVKDVRSAIDYAGKEFGVKHLLLNRRLLTGDRNLFLKEYGKLVNLSRSGQYAMECVLDAHLKRIEWRTDVPIRLYPFLSSHVADERKVIAIDPFVQFGRPTLEGKAISTAAIADRMDAGETIKSLAKDYAVGEEEIKAAIMYERAA